MSTKKKRPRAQQDPTWLSGWRMVQRHPLTAYIAGGLHPMEDEHLPRTTFVTVNRAAQIRVNKRAGGSVEEWAYVLAHVCLHLGYAHHMIPEDTDINLWNLAADHVVHGLLHSAQIGTAPPSYRLDDFPSLGRPSTDPDYLERLKLSVNMQAYGQGDIVRGGNKTSFGYYARTSNDWLSLLARGIREAAVQAIEMASGVRTKWGYQEAGAPKSMAERLMAWMMANYPLLSSLAAGFEIVEDTEVCRRLDISIAAVEPHKRIIYINPLAGLTEEEMRFVIAHEILHVALLHEQRCGTRDRYIWNIATDYKINQWLVEMNIGKMPGYGLLYDPKLTNESAEEIYNQLVQDVRRTKRLITLRGKGMGDIITGPPGWWERGDGTRIEEWVRSALSRGFELHRIKARGLLPAGLKEEIEAIAQPPIPWDARLAEWFQTQFPPKTIQRTYARASRRQSSTPDIPRPGRDKRDFLGKSRTFAVLMDTSGSMSEEDIGRGLGAIASYAIAHEVEGVRLVSCDAVAYDEGFIMPELLLQKAKVTGRGGTVLQPGIDFIQSVDDLPKDAPILVITDGWIEDNLRIAREHAYLLPKGGYLPFTPKGAVFEMA